MMNENGPMRIHIGLVPIYAPGSQVTPPNDRCQSNAVLIPAEESGFRAQRYKMRTIWRSYQIYATNLVTSKDAGAKAPSFNYKC